MAWAWARSCVCRLRRFHGLDDVGRAVIVLVGDSRVGDGGLQVEIHPAGADPWVRVEPDAQPFELGLGIELGLEGVREAPEGLGPSLVTTTHNSPQRVSVREELVKHCPNARLVEGECDEHGQRRWVVAPCKRRDCTACGPKGRHEIAKRIAYGVRQMPCRDCGHKLEECLPHGRGKGVANYPAALGPRCSCKGMLLSAAWLVLTFAKEEAEGPEWKAKAVKRLGKFVAWLRKQNPGLEYVATYELTKRGRLHINLVIGPWKEIPQAELQRRWGARVSVQWIRDDEAIGRETAKSYSPESLAGYLSKLEQAVPEEWGRRVSYSKKWPKLPKSQRKGKIRWRCEFEIEPVEIEMFEHELNLGWWKEVRDGEWQGLLYFHECDCFDLVERARDGPRVGPLRIL